MQGAGEAGFPGVFFVGGAGGHVGREGSGCVACVFDEADDVVVPFAVVGVEGGGAAVEIELMAAVAGEFLFNIPVHGPREALVAILIGFDISDPVGGEAGGFAEDFGILAQDVYRHQAAHARAHDGGVFGLCQRAVAAVDSVSQRGADKLGIGIASYRIFKKFGDDFVLFLALESVLRHQVGCAGLGKAVDADNHNGRHHAAANQGLGRGVDLPRLAVTRGGAVVEILPVVHIDHRKAVRGIGDVALGQPHIDGDGVFHFGRVDIQAVDASVIGMLNRGYGGCTECGDAQNDGKLESHWFG